MVASEVALLIIVKKNAKYAVTWHPPTCFSLALSSVASAYYKTAAIVLSRIYYKG